MKKLMLIYLFLFSQALLASCFPISYQSWIPSLFLSIPSDYFEANEEIIAFPIWRREVTLKESSDNQGYHYFGRQFILTADDLENISEIGPKKTSFGVITLSTATGKWDSLFSLILISENGKALYLKTTGSNPAKDWSVDKKIGTVGPLWSELLMKIIVADQAIANSIELYNFAILKYFLKIELKKKLNKSEESAALTFLENITIETKSKRILDSWENAPRWSKY